MISPPSGDDTLVVRHTYLRQRHANRSGTRRQKTGWIIGGIVASCLCVAGVAGLIFGS